MIDSSRTRRPFSEYMHRQLLILLLLVTACRDQESLQPTPTLQPTHQALIVRPPKKLVGIGYQTWFNQPGFSFYQCADDNVSTLNCAWGLPQAGDYQSNDPSAITRHVNQLTDAGVDFLWIDWTNNNRCIYSDPDPTKNCPIARPDQANLELSTKAVFDRVAALGKPIKIAIALGTDLEAKVNGQPASCTIGNLQEKADQVYRDFVQDPAYSGIYLHVDGKPLLTIYAGTPPTPADCGSNFPSSDELGAWTDSRFTIRWFTGYIESQEGIRDQYFRSTWWSWVDRYPTYAYSTTVSFPEHVSVVPAYPGVCSGENCIAWGMQGGMDRYGTNDCNAASLAGTRGATFASQWRRAISVDPEIVTVTAWNQWWRTPSNDSFNARCTMDIEPSVAEGDFMLQQLKTHIADFKKYKSHIILRDPNNGVWYFRAPPDFNVETSIAFKSGSSFAPVACDFNGDGYVDIGLRSSDTFLNAGKWFFRAGPRFSIPSEWTIVWSERIGSSYQPFAGDLNNDGTCEIGVRQTTTGQFFARAPSPGSAESLLFTGPTGSQHEPFVGDFNNDGAADIGYRNSSDGHFYWRKGPSFTDVDGYNWAAGAGANYHPFAGDFDGDGYWDIGLQDTNIVQDGMGRIYIKYGRPDFASNQSDFPWAAGAHYQVVTGDIR